uniref:transcription factor TBF1-like n=1 Tax=Epinephelus lanceolatus TaxID=310571 RepID=UPI001444B4B8|nr:transcription factor TBF1-like [Epinephelus lanceolatus]
MQETQEEQRQEVMQETQEEQRQELMLEETQEEQRQEVMLEETPEEQRQEKRQRLLLWMNGRKPPYRSHDTAEPIRQDGFQPECEVT